MIKYIPLVLLGLSILSALNGEHMVASSVYLSAALLILSKKRR